MRRRSTLSAIRVFSAALRGAVLALLIGVAVPIHAADGDGTARVSSIQGVGLQSWPAQGIIRYRVYLGKAGLPVGEATHAWRHDGARYSMEVELQTTGVARMLRDLHYVQRSEGRVGKLGLVPERFSVSQTGKTPSDVRFDWARGSVRISRGSRIRTGEVRPGDQDLLSLWHQVAIVGLGRAPQPITVVGGHYANPGRLELIGDEMLDLPIGRVESVRVRAEANDGKLSIDLWFSKAHRLLPLRIRIVDGKGEMLDQLAYEVKLDS